MLCNFSECKLIRRYKLTHFVKNQAILDCGMINWPDKSQYFYSISDSKCHKPSAIWVHLMPVIDLVKTSTPLVKTIYFFSDEPSTQYRQKKLLRIKHFYYRAGVRVVYVGFFQKWSR